MGEEKERKRKRACYLDSTSARKSYPHRYITHRGGGPDLTVIVPAVGGSCDYCEVSVRCAIQWSAPWNCALLGGLVLPVCNNVGDPVILVTWDLLGGIALM